jgi:hypothetical protein
VRPKSPTLLEALNWLLDDAAAGVIPFTVEAIEALSKNLSEWGGAGSSNFSIGRRTTEPANPTHREAMIRVAKGPGGKLRRTNGSTNNSVADLMAGVTTEMHGRRIIAAALAALTRKSPAAPAGGGRGGVQGRELLHQVRSRSEVREGPQGLAARSVRQLPAVREPAAGEAEGRERD